MTLRRASDLGVALLKRPVLRSAAALFGSTAVTSVLGFAFWAVAARSYAIEEVGTASAAVSAMMLLATAGLLGINTLLLGELGRGRASSGLVSASVLTVAGAASALAVPYVLLAESAGLHLGALADSWWGAGVFVAGVTATAVGMVFDNVCVGLRRAKLQLWRNTVFSAAKLLLLPVPVVLALGRDAVAIYSVWMAGNLISVVVLVQGRRDLRVGPRLLGRPHWGALRKLGTVALTHHWTNLALQAPRLLLPVLVASLLSPELNAAFYAALLIAAFAQIIPVHLSTALYAVGAGDPRALLRESKHALVISAAVAIGSAATFAVLGRPMLGLLGEGYEVASSAMVVLGIITLPMAVKTHFTAISRITGRLTSCAVAVTAGAAFEVAAAVVGAQFGLLGVAVGWLIAITAEAAVLWPFVAASSAVRTTKADPAA